MRSALPESGRRSSRAKSIPAPVGGWNALNSIADMPATDAVVLDNWWPRTSDIMVRKGTKAVAQLPAGKEIRTLMGYKGAEAVKLFAAAQDGIYDITAGGDVSAIASAATNADWQFVNTSTAGGAFLWCCNGVDSPRYFDGTSWKVLTDTSTPALTGVTPTRVVNVSQYKSRLILCCKDSLSFWYLPPASIAGAAVEFPLGSIFTRGGYLVATTAWTIDTSFGPSEFFVAVTSEGEVAVYSGSDPATASAFSLVGVFRLAKPLGRRCFFKAQAETFLLTRASIAPLSKVLRGGNDQNIVALTRKIEKAWADYGTTNFELFGWQAQYFSEASMILVNVPMLHYPARNITYSCQFAMNVTTGAWTRFTGMHAEAWVVFDGQPYYALHNRVHQAWTGASDNGANITAVAKTAFSMLGSSSAKQVKLVRPILRAGGSISLQLAVDMDYDDNIFTSSTVSYVQNLALWDQAVWNEAVWNGTSTTIATWRSVNSKVGRAAATRLRVVSKDATIVWNATDLILQDAGLM